MATYESTLAFHRVWSAVQFLFCTAARSQTRRAATHAATCCSRGPPACSGLPSRAERERESRALAARPPRAEARWRRCCTLRTESLTPLSPPIATPGTANVETPMGNLNNLVFFGEGVSVAGCLILHMLGQRHRFRLFDFCAHVCSVAETSGGAPTDPTMQVQEASEVAREGGRSLPGNVAHYA